MYIVYVIRYICKLKMITCVENEFTNILSANLLLNFDFYKFHYTFHLYFFILYLAFI